jgi:uncharacterized protein (DUF433 family)
MWKERIIIDPNVFEGKPIIKGTNVSVEYILELLAKGLSFDQILENCHQLKSEDIMATIQYSFEIADLCIR